MTSSPARDEPAQTDELAAREATLVARARSGEVQAFETLYRLHLRPLYGLCWRLCDGDARRADQATQDSFIKAWEKLPGFRADSKFGTWLHRIAVNQVLGEYRLLRRWTSFEDAPPEPAPRVGDAERSDLRCDLEAALARLPKGARAVLILHDVEGYKHEEIAELTGIAVGTSKAQLHRARKLMKEQLQ